MRRPRFVMALLAALAVLGHGRPGSGQVQLQPVLSGLSAPVFVSHAGDGTGRLFVVEKGGAIRVRQPEATTTTVFLDLQDRVSIQGERGLLGLAFHPQFATNRRFFVHYTAKGGAGTQEGDIVIAEYRASATNPNVANTDEQRILTIQRNPASANHNGGMLAFGPLDGYLYAAPGDGASGLSPAQDLGSLLGKVLRLDVDRPPDYIPLDNPFGDQIWALGFRNPWRFSFDRETGVLVLGDVGENTKEEVDIVTREGNYGWPFCEGTLPSPGECGPPRFTLPVTEYQQDGRCAIIGGYVYRGTAGTFAPGTYLFGDVCTGEIFVLAPGGTTFSVLLDTDLFITSFGEDQAGELYVVGASPPNANGTILRLATPAMPPSGGVFVAAGNLTGASVEIVTGAGAGGAPRVRSFRADGSRRLDFLAYSPAVTGGTRVAACDLTGDGRADIVTAPGPGAPPLIRGFDGTTGAFLGEFLAADPTYLGGVFVACGDVTGDGFPEIVLAADAGVGPIVAVWQVSPVLALLGQGLAYEASFTGGVRIAVCDANGDGRGDIVTGPGPGRAPLIRVFDTTTGVSLGEVLAYAPEVATGVYVGCGDVAGGGAPEILTGAGEGGSAHVKVLNALTGSVQTEFFAESLGFTGGVRVAAGNLDGAGPAELVTGAGPGGEPRVRGFTGAGLPTGTSFLAF